MIALARAEDWLPAVPDGSVQLILTDPPYRNVVAEEWDRQWPTPDDYLAWLAGIADEWRRALAPNGSLYCFASPAMAARVEVMLAERFRVLNRIVWAKPGIGREGQAELAALRSYWPRSEVVLFAEHYGADSMAAGESGWAAQCADARAFVFEPLRAYLDGERMAAGLSVQDVAEAWRVRTGNANRTGMAGHWFSTVQWALPTEEVYLWLREVLNRDGTAHLRREYDDLRREYDDLRREYDDLRQEFERLRRPFHVSADVPHTDVWTYATVEGVRGRHPCEKPLDMLRDVIRASSREGDTVLDCFAGRASTACAAIDTGRRPIGCEADPHWHAEGADRMERHRAIVEKRAPGRRVSAATITGPLFEANPL